MEVNAYGRQLSADEIERKEHRTFVGGFWEELGDLQLSFLIEHGLLPQHTLVDIGCGALRGGIPIARYLDAGNYHGVDINASLIEAGLREIEESKLIGKDLQLLTSEKFELRSFGKQFDYAIAISLFTHLPMNHIVRCLVETKHVLKPGARLYATYFTTPTPACLEPVEHTPGGVVTGYDSDPYHYSLAEFQWMARLAQLDIDAIGAWGHPRGQQMLVFTNHS